MIDVVEQFDGRRVTTGNKPGTTLGYILRRDEADLDTPDDADLKIALIDEAPAWLVDDYNAQLLIPSAYTVSARVGDSIWFGTVTYGPEEQNKRDGESVYTFETTGGSQKIFQSLATTDRGAATGLEPPDFKGAIGVTEDSVDGVDITVPIFKFTETWYLRTLTNGYANTLFALTGTTNANTFRDLSEAECLFLGARGSKRGRGDWEITFEFAASQSRFGIVIGDISAVAKLGWEYLWVRYKKTVVNPGTDWASVAMVPTFAYVEQVYAETDWTPIGIG